MTAAKDFVRFLVRTFDPDHVDDAHHVPGPDPRVARRVVTSTNRKGITEPVTGERFRLTPAAAAILSAAEQARMTAKAEKFSACTDFDLEYRRCLVALAEYLETIPETCLVAINRERMKSG